MRLNKNEIGVKLSFIKIHAKCKFRLFEIICISPISYNTDIILCTFLLSRMLVTRQIYRLFI